MVVALAPGAAKHQRLVGETHSWLWCSVAASRQSYAGYAGGLTWSGTYGHVGAKQVASSLFRHGFVEMTLRPWHQVETKLGALPQYHSSGRALLGVRKTHCLLLFSCAFSLLLPGLLARTRYASLLKSNMSATLNICPTFARRWLAGGGKQWHSVQGTHCSRAREVRFS